VSYVVLARKYRPQRFEDMIGQEHVARTLGNAIRQDRVHHAYLFAGARGLGKTTTARILAKGLVCVEGPTPDPCNACHECVAINESRSVDVLEIDGASNNSVDDIRSLREQVHYLPQSARRKVYIIDEVHMLTTSAFNALLKTLEEPPPHVNFIFATTEPQKVLATILSRVSRLDFRRVSAEETVAHLKGILEREELHVDDGGLQLVARASAGSVRDGLTLLDQVLAFADDPHRVSEDEARRVLGQADRSAVARLVDAIISGDADRLMAQLTELLAGGLDIMVLCMQLLEHLRDLTLMSVCKTRDVLGSLTDSEYEELKAAAGKADSAHLGQLFDRLTRIVDRIPASRVPRLLVEMGLIELARMEPVIPLGDLVERLQALSDGTPSPPTGGATSSNKPNSGGRRPSTGRPSPAQDFSSEPSPHPRGVKTGPGSEAEPSRFLQSEEPPPIEDAPIPGDVSRHDAKPDREDWASTDAVPREHGTNTSRSHPARTSSSFREPSNRPDPPVGHEPQPLRNGQSSSDPSSAHRSSREPQPLRNGQSSSDPSSTSGSRGSVATPPASNDVGVSPNFDGGFDPPPRAREDDTDDPSLEIAENPLARSWWEMAKGAVLAREPATTPDPTSRPTNGHHERPRPNTAILDRIEVKSPDAFADWKAVVERIRADDPSVSAALCEAGLVSLHDGVLRLCARMNTFTYADLSGRHDIRSRLVQATREQFGHPFALEVIDGEPSLADAPSLNLVEARRREEQQSRVEADARSDTRIRRLLEVFHGRVTQVQPLGEPR